MFLAFLAFPLLIMMPSGTPPPSPPPRVFSYFNNDTDQRPWLRHVPRFADIPRTETPWEYMFDDVLEHHRCKTCRTMLCCGEYIWHDPDCWAAELRVHVVGRDIAALHNYRQQVFQGAMEGYTDWAFDMFDRERHYSLPFQPHKVGLFIRCRKCPRCRTQICNATYHNHSEN